MIRTFTLLVIAMCMQLQANAQYWLYAAERVGKNPRGLNIDSEFPVGGGLPAGWTTIAGPGANPQWSANRALPFAFQFNGQPVTNFKISNSGVLTFDVGTALPAPPFQRAALPNPAIPNNSVCIWGLGGIGANDNTVTKVFGTAPNRQYFIQFNSYGYGTVPSDGQSYCYWSIVLEETSNKIYIVDQRSNGYAGTNQLSAGIQINENTAIVIPGSPDFTTKAGFDATPIDNSYYEFTPGTQPAIDMSGVSITTDAYQIQGNVQIAGKLLNIGTETVNSFTLNYSVDLGDTVSTIINGANIPTFGTYDFTHPKFWNANSGTSIVEVWASNINGKEDENKKNDLASKSIFVLTEKYQRTPLFEVFTSSTCAPCKPGNENFHRIVDIRPQEEFITVKYQQDFPGTGDPYATTETVNRRAYYAINSIPRMEIDGKWDKNASLFTDELYDEYRAIPAPFRVWGNYTQNEKKFDAKVFYTPYFNSKSCKLFTCIMEFNTEKNVKTNGETNFAHVVKKMLPTEQGTNIANLNPGQVDSTSLSFTFAGGYRLPADGAAANRINHTREHSVEDFNNLYMVAWVQGPDKVVYNAVLLTQNTTGISDVPNAISQLDVFPNPAQDNINISFETKTSEAILMSVVDMHGNTLHTERFQSVVGKQTKSISAEDFPSGMYHVLLFDSSRSAAIHEVSIIR